MSYSKLAVIIDLQLIDYSHNFKKTKIEELTTIVREISLIEVESSNMQANYWSRALQDPKLTHLGETTSVNVH